MNEQIYRRRFALKYNLEQLRIAYEQTKRDALLDVGLEYGVKYEDNEWYHDKDKAYRNLTKQREYILFTCIINFTQCYYMIKEYLKKIHPEYSKQVEEFYSNFDILNIPRKLISNDLKHNPQNDIEFDFREVRRETTRQGKMIVHTTYMKSSWFYKDLETVEYCNKLYVDLEEFIENLFKKKEIQKST